MNTIAHPNAGHRPLPSGANGHPVVIVEDDDDIRDVFREVLESEGYDVLTARNGRDALEVLDHTPATPCVMILDLMMPVMDGWELMDELQHEEKLKRLPVIVLSAVAHGTEPAARVLRKPVDVEVLLRTVRDVC